MTPLFTRRSHLLIDPAARRSFQWQSYVPTLALLVSDPSPNGLGQNITVVGYLYFAFVGTTTA